MLDAFLFRHLGPRLAPVAAILSNRVNASVLTLAAFVSGAAALPAIGFHKYWLALGVLVLRGVLQGLSAIVGQAGVRAPWVGMLDLLLDAAIPFAFALAMPERALAAMFLLLGLVVRAGSVGVTSDGRGLVGRTELFLAFALACIFPDRFSIIGYVIGTLCFVGAGQRLAQVSSS